MTTPADDLIRAMVRQQTKSDDETVRHLLSQWVSELEPSVVWHNGKIVGLCVAGDLTGSLAVRVFDIRPAITSAVRSFGCLCDDAHLVTPGRDLGYD